MTRHRSQSVVCTGVTRCHVGSETFGDRCPPLQHRAEWFHHPKRPLFPLFTLPSTPATTVSIVLSFPEYHIGVSYYVAFSDLILSASDMCLRFFHVFSELISF